MLALRAVLGGVVVVLFALASEGLKPKEFAGLFAAAPSVALAGLLLTGLKDGNAGLRLAATGMIAGAVGMTVYCIVGVYAVRRWHAKLGALMAFPAWAAS